MLRLLIPAVVVLAAGCRPAAAGHTAADTTRAGQLEAFRRGLARPESLSDGSASREELVRRFARAMQEQDTAALRAMVLSRAEFAWLYYPTTPQAAPPYDLDPELLWFTLFQRSDRDLGLALQEFGGRRFGYVAHKCSPRPRREGANNIWGYCSVQRRLPGETRIERPFGLIIERDGRFKFVSYANRLS